MSSKSMMITQFWDITAQSKPDLMVNFRNSLQRIWPKRSENFPGFRRDKKRKAQVFAQ